MSSFLYLKPWTQPADFKELVLMKIDCDCHLVTVTKLYIVCLMKECVLTCTVCLFSSHTFLFVAQQPIRAFSFTDGQHQFYMLNWSNSPHCEPNERQRVKQTKQTSLTDTYWRTITGQLPTHNNHTFGQWMWLLCLYGCIWNLEHYTTNTTKNISLRCHSSYFWKRSKVDKFLYLVLSAWIGLTNIPCVNGVSLF